MKTSRPLLRQKATKEITAFVKAGLQDFSISRLKENALGYPGS